MGWITNRRMIGGRGIGGYRKTFKSDAPLRKIVQIIHVSTLGLFGRDQVLLECGHKAFSNATFRARCAECKRELLRRVEILPSDEST
ncbi:MAG TPA: hypothetical protein VGQ59_11525 [Cyclobacteriaceae bacterium]|jgi:hypothetical protein|nr:hypothetical protein [Cyclobacteriaceae bacterium]